MRLALVCTECFDLTWKWDITIHEWKVGYGRRWWTCTDCVPLGSYSGEVPEQIPTWAGGKA